METKTIIYLYKNDNKFFGPGPYELLLNIKETGSLRKASDKMNMSYSKALRLIKTAEESLGYNLTQKRIGGIAGGGSMLTKEAEDFIKQYHDYMEACNESNRRLYLQFFDE